MIPYIEEKSEVTEEFYNKYCVSCGSQRCTRSGEWLEGCQHYKVYNKLQPCKEETMDRKNTDNWAKWDLPDGYEFQDKDGNIINTSVIRLVKKQIQYPKTYEECRKLSELNCNPYSEIILSNIPIHEFCKLIVARNTYWKIAGEQMDLGKPWEPDTCQIVHSIARYSNEVVRHDDMYGRFFILEFPTAEMRDSFYENFKDLIENVKELL